MSGLIRVGAVTRQGLTTEIRLDGDGIQVTARMTESDAERLVAAVLLRLAEMNPLRWDRIFNDVRDIGRAP